MNNNNFRNSELLQKLARHPLKASLARALDIAENFQGDVQFLQLDKNLSAEGRNNARQAKLRAAIRDLRDVRAPIGELQKKLDAKRAAVAMPAFDPNDVVGFLRRQELRATLRTMDAGQRALLLKDPAFADAMLEQPPALSGLLPAEQFIIDATKEDRLKGLFGPQLAEIEELEKTVAEANMIADLARVDLKLHSSMDDRQFTEFCKPVESKANAPWLRRDKNAAGDEVILVFDLEAHVARVATPDQVRDGKFYADHAAYLADRAA